MRERIRLKRSGIRDMFITLLALYFMLIFYYGVIVLQMLAVAVVSAFVFDGIALKIFFRGYNEPYDFSTVISAMIITLLLPAGVPYWIIVLGVGIAAFVAKYPFGGSGKNIFNPAAAALAFIGLSWPEIVFAYPEPNRVFDLTPGASVLVNSPESYLKAGAVPQISYMDVLAGHFAGPMGATLVVVIAACAVYLFYRKQIRLFAPLSFLCVIWVVALLLPRIEVDFLHSLMFETVSGVILFGAVFMVSDPVTSPQTSLGQVLYGLLLGVVGIIFRFYGTNEYGFICALLMVNPLNNWCDKTGNRILKKIERVLPSHNMN